MQKVEAPEPGVYLGIPEKEYRAWDCAHYSGLKKITISSEQYMWEKLHPKPQTDPMMLGSATDTYILSPKKYDSQYYEHLQPIDKRTKAGKEALAEAELEARGRIILLPKQWEPIHEMRESVMNHRVASELLSSGDSQVSIVWIDKETGVKCKGRLDWYNGKMKRIIDLKTTATKHIDDFGKQVFNLGYYIQDAMYSKGAEQVGLEFNRFNIIAVQSEAPYRVKVFHLTNETLYAGSEQYRGALYEWKRCTDISDWSDYQTDASLTIPLWYLRQEGIEVEGSAL